MCGMAQVCYTYLDAGNERWEVGHRAAQEVVELTKQFCNDVVLVG